MDVCEQGVSENAGQGRPINVLIVVTPNGRGTGFLIEPNLVVTAGHVVQPYQRTLTPLANISVHTPAGIVLQPTAVKVHRSWSNGFRRSADMAILRLAHQPPDEEVVEILEDAAADSLAVSIAGFDSGAEVTNTGTTSRVENPNDLDVFTSSDLTFPSGVSGGPIRNEDQIAIGIATWSHQDPAQDSFIGIPFLEATLGWLRKHV